METTIVDWGYIGAILGIMEKKMATTLLKGLYRLNHSTIP